MYAHVTIIPWNALLGGFKIRLNFASLVYKDILVKFLFAKAAALYAPDCVAAIENKRICVFTTIFD